MPLFPGATGEGKDPSGNGKGWHVKGVQNEFLDRDFARAVNVGVMTGTALDEHGFLWVVDPDLDGGGLAEWQQLCAEHNYQPNTFTVRTGNGGLHLYYRTKRPMSGTNIHDHGKLNSRGVNGQVVSFGCVNRVSGGAYSYVSGYPRELEWAPDWLLALGRTHNEAKRVASVGPQTLDVTPEMCAEKAALYRSGRMHDLLLCLSRGEAWSAPKRRHDDIVQKATMCLVNVFGRQITDQSVVALFEPSYRIEPPRNDWRKELIDGLEGARGKVDETAVERNASIEPMLIANPPPPPSGAEQQNALKKLEKAAKVVKSQGLDAVCAQATSLKHWLDTGALKKEQMLRAFERALHDHDHKVIFPSSAIEGEIDKGLATQPTARSSSKAELLLLNDHKSFNDQALAALVKDQCFYQRGNRLVRLLGDAKVIDLPKESLHEQLTTLVRVVKRVEGEVKEVGLPPWCSSELHARGHWHDMRKLNGVVRTPTLLENGRILQTPGYDVDSGLIYNPQCEYPMVSERPTYEDARNAARQLFEVFAEFPFESPADLGACIASVLTLVGRHAIKGNVPLFAFDAPTARTGKTLAAEIAGLIGLGEDLPLSSYPAKDDEMKKQLTGFAVTAKRAHAFDNVDRGVAFGCASLLQAITASQCFSDRILGSTNDFNGTFPTVLFATGNNITFAPDMPQRTARVRMVSDHERPGERTNFQIKNLRAYVRERQPALTVAALTVLRAYCVAGMPVQPVQLDRAWGNFEEFSQLVRGTVLWLSNADYDFAPSNIDDHQSDFVSELLCALELAFPNGVEFKTQQLSTVAIEMRAAPARPPITAEDEVGRLLSDHLGGDLTAERVGKLLRKHVDVTLDGRRLCKGPSRQRPTWRVCKTS